MIDYIKNKLNKNKFESESESEPEPEPEPISYIGSIDEFSFEKLRGWVALSNKQKLTEDIVISTSNTVDVVIDKLEYREDLHEHGIADGYAAFEVDYPKIDSPEIELKIKIGQTIFFNRKISNAALKAKNKDPYFNGFYEKSLSKNSSSRLDDGLNIQLLYANDYEKKYSSSYFYRLSNSKKNKKIN
jgi:hypothetical protein